MVMSFYVFSVILMENLLLLRRLMRFLGVRSYGLRFKLWMFLIGG